MKTRFKCYVVFGLVALFTACGGSTSTMVGEYSSMSKCLAGMKSSSGENLKIITDKPNKVSGKLSNGEFFSCKFKSTGTKGQYYEGYYTVKE